MFSDNSSTGSSLVITGTRPASPGTQAHMGNARSLFQWPCLHSWLQAVELGGGTWPNAPCPQTLSRSRSARIGASAGGEPDPDMPPLAANLLIPQLKVECRRNGRAGIRCHDAHSRSRKLDIEAYS